MLFMQVSEFLPFWGSEPGRVLGVFVSANALFLVELERTEESNRFRVRQAREEKWRGEKPSWEDAESLSENIMRLCSTYGLAYDKISMCLPRELFFVYEREFPPMERWELTEAVRWDIETNVPFAEGKYWTGFGRHDDRLELSALPSEYGRELVKAMTEAGLGIEGLTMEPLRFTYRREGMRILWREAAVELSVPAARMDWPKELLTALYAALRLYYPSVGTEFMPPGEKAETAQRWHTAGNVLLACAMVILALLLARNMYLLSAAEKKMDALRQEYALETRGRKAMGDLVHETTEVAETEKTLQKLGTDRRSWYAVFSALGATAVDGVYLTELDTREDGALLCGGRALDYGRLVAYMERLEENGTKLREKPALKESAADERGEVQFRILLRF